MLVRRFGNVKTKEDGPRFEVSFALAGFKIVEDPVTQDRILTLTQRAQQWDPQAASLAIDYALSGNVHDLFTWLEDWREGEFDDDYKRYLCDDFYRAIGGRPNNSHCVLLGPIPVAE